MIRWLFLNGKRAFHWRDTMTEPFQAEVKALDKANVVMDNEVRSYFVWRRSIIIFCLPSLLASAALGIYNIATESETLEIFGVFGKFAVIMPFVAPSILFLGALLSLCSWTKLRDSAALMAWGWFIAVLMPIWPTIIPENLLITEDIFKLNDFESYQIRAQAFTRYLVQIIPVFVSIPRGVIGGSIRICGILPESPLPGWIIVVVAPFLSMVMLVFLILVTQVVGNGFLLAGTMLLVVSPLLYFLASRYIAQPLCDQDEVIVGRVQKAVIASQMIGIGLIVMWALTFDSGAIRIIGPVSDENALISYKSAIRLGLDAFGQALSTIVVVADGVLHMVLIDWSTTRKRIAEFGKEGQFGEANLHEWYQHKVSSICKDSYKVTLGSVTGSEMLSSSQIETFEDEDVIEFDDMESPLSPFTYNYPLQHLQSVQVQEISFPNPAYSKRLSMASF